MKVSVAFAVALAASAEAAVLERRQRDIPDVSDCGLDAFVGHTSEALLFCSSILKSGTATQTITQGVTTTTTTTKKVTTTVSISKKPTPTPSPPPKSTPTPTPTPTSKPTPTPPKSSTPAPPPSSTRASSTIVTVPSPSTTPGAGCGIVAYVKSTPAYYFESSGTKNTFSACQALCKADSKCLSFGYGEANCMLFDVKAEDNTNYNPQSPYTFYDVGCPSELPVRKRQLDLPGNPGGIAISLTLGGPSAISSACSCLITKGPADTTVTRTNTSNVTRTATTTTTVTTTVGGTD